MRCGTWQQLLWGLISSVVALRTACAQELSVGQVAASSASSPPAWLVEHQKCMQDCQHAKRRSDKVPPDGESQSESCSSYCAKHMPEEATSKKREAEDAREARRARQKHRPDLPVHKSEHSKPAANSRTYAVPVKPHSKKRRPGKRWAEL
mmetsp:Transcript_27233/g.49993  ORF Transcript_27233/g.49993 Transcript_27233/m.49993 type:complete len:150 (-) Transcript_27233:3-452(-)